MGYWLVVKSVKAHIDKKEDGLLLKDCNNKITYIDKHHKKSLELKMEAGDKVFVWIVKSLQRNDFCKVKVTDELTVSAFINNIPSLTIPDIDNMSKEVREFLDTVKDNDIVYNTPHVKTLTLNNLIAIYNLKAALDDEYLFVLQHLFNNYGTVLVGGNDYATRL